MKVADKPAVEVADKPAVEVADKPAVEVADKPAVEVAEKPPEQHRIFEQCWVLRCAQDDTRKNNRKSKDEDREQHE